MHLWMGTLGTLTFKVILTFCLGWCWVILQFNIYREYWLFAWRYTCMFNWISFWYHSLSISGIKGAQKLTPGACQTKLVLLLISLPSNVLSQLTIYGCSNVSTTLGKRYENVGKLSCCKIFQETFKNVATMLPKKVARKHLHNIMATFIHFDKVLWYSQCGGNLSAIWESPRKSYQDML